MNAHHWATRIGLAALIGVAACDGGTAPTASTAPPSFLAGTWHGTVTIQVNPEDPGASGPTSGAVEWIVDVVSQTNAQTFRSTLRLQHPWLPASMTGTTALVPQNVPPAQVSTQGEYASPRGCRGTFGSVGAADATHIEADLTGVDCDHATFVGRVTLTKN